MGFVFLCGEPGVSVENEGDWGGRQTAQATAVVSQRRVGPGNDDGFGVEASANRKERFLSLWVLLLLRNYGGGDALLLDGVEFRGWGGGPGGEGFGIGFGGLSVELNQSNVHAPVSAVSTE